MDIMGGMLTKGLGGTACTHLIFGPFKLHCGDVPHPIPSGGTSVRIGSEVAGIVNRRRDVKEETQLKAKKQITVTFSLNNNTHEKTFIVDPDKANRIVKAAEWVDKTRERFKIFIDKFTKTTHNEENNNQ